MAAEANESQVDIIQYEFLKSCRCLWSIFLSDDNRDLIKGSIH